MASLNQWLCAVWFVVCRIVLVLCGRGSFIHRSNLTRVFRIESTSPGPKLNAPTTYTPLPPSYLLSLMVGCVIGLFGLDVGLSQVQAHASITSLLCRLQSLADTVVSEFRAAGFLTRQAGDSNSVKLHITLMNTLFRKDPTGAEISQTVCGKPRESFNAKPVLQVCSVQ